MLTVKGCTWLMVGHRYRITLREALSNLLVVKAVGWPVLRSDSQRRKTERPEAYSGAAVVPVLGSVS